MSLYFALYTVENNKNKKSVKFQGDTFDFYDFIQVFVFTSNHHLNWWISFAPEFQCCYFCVSSCLFYLSFNFDFYVSKIMHL